MAEILAFYTMTVVFFLWSGLHGQVERLGDLFAAIWLALVWPVAYVPWRDWYHPGGHRRHRHAQVY
jgi:hypothetical protein